MNEHQAVEADRQQNLAADRAAYDADSRERKEKSGRRSRPSGSR
jgi:hypothetical protein